MLPLRLHAAGPRDQQDGVGGQGRGQRFRLQWQPDGAEYHRLSGDEVQLELPLLLVAIGKVEGLGGPGHIQQQDAGWQQDEQRGDERLIQHSDAPAGASAARTD